MNDYNDMFNKHCLHTVCLTLLLLSKGGTRTIKEIEKVCAA